jgi:hypothetical protein
VKVTYTYAVVPDGLRDAAIITAAAVYGPESGVIGGVRSDAITLGDFTRSTTYTNAAATLPGEALRLLDQYIPPVVA